MPLPLLAKELEHNLPLSEVSYKSLLRIVNREIALEQDRAACKDPANMLRLAEREIERLKTDNDRTYKLYSNALDLYGAHVRQLDTAQAALYKIANRHFWPIRSNREIASQALSTIKSFKP